MPLKRIGWYSVLAVVLFCTPLLAMAQIQIQLPLPPGWPQFPDQPPPAPPERYADEPRGLLEVINDWEDQVSITVWTNQRERIGEWVAGGSRSVPITRSRSAKTGAGWMLARWGSSTTVRGM